jgi:hypothetical protein
MRTGGIQLNYGLLNRNLDTGTFYNDYYSEISDILFYMIK